MPLKGFEKGFTKSKVAEHVIKDGYSEGTLVKQPYTTNISKQNIGLRSNTPAAVNPTTDADDNPRAVGGLAPQDNGDSPMVPSSKGGASGDGPTPGYDGSGSGQATLNGAQQ